VKETVVSQPNASVRVTLSRPPRHRPVRRRAGHAGLGTQLKEVAAAAAAGSNARRSSHGPLTFTLGGAAREQL